MKKDEIIVLLKEQLNKSEEREHELMARVDALIAEVSSLKEALLSKGESLNKQQRINKGLSKIVSNVSEKQTSETLKLCIEEKEKAEQEKKLR